MKRLTLIATVIGFLLSNFSTSLAQEITVRGRLRATVEAGGWLIANDTTKYLILNSRSFQDEPWFKEGTQVEAVGERKSVSTIYMEGMPFEVRTMVPVAQAATQTPATADNRRITRVMVTGDSIVQAQPDTATVTIAVITQNKRAIDAQQENATKSDAVVRAVKSAAGTGGEVKTSGYNVQPERIYREGQPPTITGYEARNAVTVTMSDLTKVGAVIDAASVAGANDVTGISFSLRQDQPARDQALKDATREALSKAQVIAQALGGRVIRIIEVQEEGFEKPRPVYEAPMNTAMLRAAPATPIEVGSLDITSRVQLVAEVETNL
ncbi:MAG: SIMPL domain-containing protein [Pyrinomonadaceae bacterium]